ncbi:hypothetical protein [Streptomyces sp. CT34]|uniref:hypothetical protein n=1 Tax=Streptomyces sp. CT34 TaxID=1553907 RepID=UPI0005BC43D1|nr:hypothetical protein [Streptomyces sp. CT34]
MRRHTATALVLTTLTALTVAGCSNDSASTSASSSASSPATSTPRNGDSAPDAEPLSSAALSKRLLTVEDLGEGYVRKAERAQHNDDVTVLGCPALDKLGGDAATGGTLNFPRKVKVAFSYGAASTSEVSEELYSDTAQKLSEGVGRIFDAMASCPKYQVVSGSTSIDMTTQKTAAPRLGDERWSQLLTYSTGGQRSIVKQTAVRTGGVLVILTGSPGLVDAHVEKAVDKVHRAE